MDSSTRRTVPVVALFAALVLLAGCTGTPAATPTAPTEVKPGYLAVADPAFAADGELVVQLDYDTAETAGLDPQAAATARSWMIEGLSYETLTTIDEKLGVVGKLAKSWETPDPTTYVFTLVDDAVFSNGRAMTADDVTASLQRLLDQPTTWTGQLGPVDRVKTTGELEVTVTLTRPHGSFLAALANTPAAILPMTEINDGRVDLATEMVGTGPLMPTSRRQDEEWIFEPNPHHPGADSLGFDRLRLAIVGDEATRAAGLRDGTADLAVLNSADSADLLSTSAGVNVVTQRNTDFHYVMINSIGGKPALRDERVRFALNALIDRTAINELALAGRSEPTAITPAGMTDSCAAAALPSASAEATAAIAVIKELPAPLELNLLVYTDEPVLAQIAQVIQQNLAEAGVKITIEQLDYASYSDRVYAEKSNFDLALSWFAGYADPAMVTTWWDPESAGFSKPFLRGSAELDTLIGRGYTTEPGAARAAVFTELCALSDRQSELVPLVLRPSILAWNTETLSPTLTSQEGYGNFLRRLTEFRAS